MIFIRYFAPVNDQTAQRLIAAVQGADEVTLLLATPGGSTDAGIAVHNFLKASTVKITAVNMGVVASIGTVIFCAAENRLSMPQARFSFHPNAFHIQNETLGVWQLEEKANQLKVEHESIARIISSATSKPLEETRNLILQHRSLSPDEAKDFGLVHEVRQFEIPKGVKLLAIDG